MIPYLLFYVENPVVSAKAIEALLGHAPVEAGPTFVLFALFVIDGMRLGLWGIGGVRPAPERHGENSEISIEVATREDVDRHHTLWRDGGLSVLQAPETMDFGYTATVALPGPLRLRMFHPDAMPA